MCVTVWVAERGSVREEGNGCHVNTDASGPAVATATTAAVVVAAVVTVRVTSATAVTVVIM